MPRQGARQPGLGPLEYAPLGRWLRVGSAPFERDSCFHWRGRYAQRKTYQEAATAPPLVRDQMSGTARGHRLHRLDGLADAGWAGAGAAVDRAGGTSGGAASATFSP